VDVGFTELQYCDFKDCERHMRARYAFKAGMSREELYSHKYLAVVDGNSWSARYQWFMLDSRSLVFYNGIFDDWFMWRLKPWVHYVPFKLDLTDLEEKIDWVRKNDARAKKIADNAHTFANKYLRDEDLKCYAGLLMLEYASLLE
jgi:hypothetical protein